MVPRFPFSAKKQPVGLSIQVFKVICPANTIVQQLNRDLGKSVWHAYHDGDSIWFPWLHVLASEPNMELFPSFLKAGRRQRPLLYALGVTYRLPSFRFFHP
jgi:hypothetical protein